MRSAPCSGIGEVPRHVERRRPSGASGSREVDPHHRPFEAGGERRRLARGRHRPRPCARWHRPPRTRARRSATACGKIRAIHRLVLERVLLHLEPDEGQRVGRVVGVPEGHRPMQDLCAGVERGVQVVVRAVLPVGVTGRTARRAIHRGRAHRQRREDRGVGRTGVVEAAPRGGRPGWWRGLLGRQAGGRRQHDEHGGPARVAAAPGDSRHHGFRDEGW